MNNYYISDLHFGHENILRFDNRPFATTEEMEEEIIKRWNARVTPQDTVYVLGDFCWRTASEWVRIAQKLKGRKVLIRGNHDPKKVDGKLRKLFEDVKDYKEVIDNGRFVCMSHFPILLYNHAVDPNAYMLCGHVHMTHENDWLEKWRHELRTTDTGRGRNWGNIINVGAMLPYMDYTPRTLDELIAGVGFEASRAQ